MEHLRTTRSFHLDVAGSKEDKMKKESPRGKTAARRTAKTQPEKGSRKQGLARTDEAAEFLSISRSGVYHLMDTGDIPFRMIGKSRRVSWDWLYKQTEY